MDLGSLLLFLALLLLAALFVARPLLAAPDVHENPQLANLQAERQRVLDALAELDADWELGKVPAEVYQPQRNQLLAEGAAVLRALEAAPLQAPAAAEPEASDARLEAMIKAHKKRGRQ